jgi:hypothetical protein
MTWRWLSSVRARVSALALAAGVQGWGTFNTLPQPACRAQGASSTLMQGLVQICHATSVLPACLHHLLAHEGAALERTFAAPHLPRPQLLSPLARPSVLAPSWPASTGDVQHPCHRKSCHPPVHPLQCIAPRLPSSGFAVPESYASTVPQITIASAGLARGLFEMFLGSGAVVPDARAAWVEGAKLLLESEQVKRAARKAGS